MSLPTLSGNVSSFQYQQIRRPSDVVELADSLGIDTFAVLGSSGGAPFALACAALLPSRVRVVGVVGAVAPVDAQGVRAAGN